MKLLTYGDIIDSGSSVFTVICQEQDRQLHINFKGSIRIDNPYKYLAYFLEEIKTKVADHRFMNSVLDFTGLSYCNSNGFYVLMDIIDLVYAHVKNTITVKRIVDDDWHQHTLPVLLNIDNSEVYRRTIFEEIERLE